MDPRQIAAMLESEFPIEIEWIGKRSFIVVLPDTSPQEADDMMRPKIKELVSEPTLEDASFEDIANSYKAMETALQALTGQVLHLRTELLVIKAEVVAQREPIERLTQQKMSGK